MQPRAQTYLKNKSRAQGALAAAVQKTIALVESHETLRCLYELELQDEGYNTISLARHAELIPLLADSDVHLLISDDEYLEQSLLEITLKQNIPIIIHTGYPARCTCAPGGHSIAVLLKTADTVALKNKIQHMLAHVHNGNENSLPFHQKPESERHTVLQSGLNKKTTGNTWPT